MALAKIRVGSNHFKWDADKWLKYRDWARRARMTNCRRGWRGALTVQLTPLRERI